MTSRASIHSKESAMNKKLIKLISLITLISLIAATLISCGVNINRVETKLEGLANESNGKYNFVVSEGETLTNVKTELQLRIGKKFDGNVTDCLTLSDKENGDFCSVLSFEKESDAKLLEENCNAAFLGAYVLRKGKIIFVGDKNVVDLVLEKI